MFWVFIILFAALDIYLYTTVDSQKRASSLWYKFIGGGIVARLKYGKN